MISSGVEERLVNFGLGSDGLRKVDNLHAGVRLGLVDPDNGFVGQDKNDSAVGGTKVGHGNTRCVVDPLKRTPASDTAPVLVNFYSPTDQKIMI